MGRQMFFVLAIMIFAGMLGGLINYLFRLENSSTAKWNFKIIFRFAITGIGAASLIPLFLSLGRSSILDDLLNQDPAFETERIKNYFTFFGFSLLASIYSKAFIENLSSKLIKEVNDAKKEMKKSVEESKQVKDFLIEGIADVDDVEVDREDQSFIQFCNSLDDQEDHVIQSFDQFNKKFLTKDFISNRLGLASDRLIKTAESLEEKDLLKHIVSESGKTWYLTKKGKKVLKFKTQK